MAVIFNNGQIADTPATISDDVRVSVPNLTQADRVVYGPLSWKPQVNANGAVIAPTLGDKALIAIDDSVDGAQWIVSWTGARVLSPVKLSSTPINGAGIPGSKRAGRILTLADFITLLGVTAPIALYQLDGLNDVSGNGRTLNNTTAAVTFGSVGPTGLPNTAALFTGNTAMGLWLADGNGGPFNPRTVSCGCWFAIPKRGGTSCRLLAKGDNTAGTRSWFISAGSGNIVQFQASSDGTNQTLVNGTTDVADGRWHFAVGTYDGEQARLYVDMSLDAIGSIGGTLFQGSMPFNIGNQAIAAVGGSGSNPMNGRIASAFVTADVLNDDQVRLLGAATIPHGMSTIPDEVYVNVRRRRRGKPLVQSDFTSAPASLPAAPVRLYNHNTGSFSNLGSEAGGALTSTGGPILLGGPDGTGRASVYLQAGTFYTASVPACFGGLNKRSAGCWFAIQSGSGTIHTMICLGGGSATDMRMLYINSNGTVGCYDGVAAALLSTQSYDDARWHFGVSVWDFDAVDGQKRKVYVDGRFVAGDTNFNSTVITGGSLYIGRRGAATTEDLIGVIANSFVCDFALTPEQQLSLYALGSRALPPSPFDSGEIVEAMDATNLYVICDQLEPQHLVDFKVAS